MKEFNNRPGHLSTKEGAEGVRIAIIAGTGIDEMGFLAAGSPTRLVTRFGFADVVEATMGDRQVIFVPRHGPAHSTPPSRINYRAQIAALAKAGVEAVIGVCAVGSLRADLGPGSFAILSDFVDLTKSRQATFFDSAEGPVVHTDFTQPYCPAVSATLAECCEQVGVRCEPGAVYVGVEGPRYESPAEIRLYASWGGDVIGMTNLPEAVLAREAGLCYGALAIVANLAAGLSPTPLSHDDVRSAMASSAAKLQAILTRAAAAIPEQRFCSCGDNRGLVT
jgi:5'-methylthioadenosine phosphorylase